MTLIDTHSHIYLADFEEDRQAIIERADKAGIIKILMPAIDSSLPSELSARTIDGVLRGKLGYDGVVITDGLYMQGISARWTLSQASVLSIMAGDDLVEGPYTPQQVAAVVSAFKQAIQQGKLTIDRINQSVKRILLMKLEYGIIKL